MTTHRDVFRLHDLLDGSLPPAEEAALRESLTRDSDLQAEYREIFAVHALLSHPLDMEVPAGLRSGILEAIRADRALARMRFRLPSWAENTLVFGGATGLAGFVAMGRAFGADWAVPWLGRLSVGAVDALGVAKTAAVDTHGSLSQMDWAVRLVSTVVNAGWTAVGSSADVLAVCVVSSMLVTGAVGWAVLRNGRSIREGMGHAHLLA